MDDVAAGVLPPQAASDTAMAASAISRNQRTLAIYGHCNGAGRNGPGTQAIRKIDLGGG
jgi:hypothetical protein